MRFRVRDLGLVVGLQDLRFRVTRFPSTGPCSEMLSSPIAMMWMPFCYIGYILGLYKGLYRDNGKDNGNYYNGLYRARSSSRIS